MSNEIYDSQRQGILPEQQKVTIQNHLESKSGESFPLKTLAEFQLLQKSTTGFSLIFFYCNWQKATQIYETWWLATAKKYPDAKFHVNIDATFDICNACEMQGTPSIQIYYHGVKKRDYLHLFNYMGTRPRSITVDVISDLELKGWFLSEFIRQPFQPEYPKKNVFEFFVDAKKPSSLTTFTRKVNLPENF